MNTIKDNIYTLSLYYIPIFIVIIIFDNYEKYMYNIRLIYEFSEHITCIQILLNFEIVFCDSISRF